MGLPKTCEISLTHKYEQGERNLITDVSGIKVGHVTLKGNREPGEQGDINTGVTAVIPCEDNIFQNKAAAGACVINGFGKSIGILQIQELGTLETPIVMTNTMSIGTAYTALCRYMLSENPDIGVKTGTVNCVVTECNDGKLNDIRGMHVTEEDVDKALKNASSDFEEGAVGGGTGMCCLGLKGGIGSASRILNIDGEGYTIGALCMSNFGAEGNLIIDGKHYDTSVKNIRAFLKKTEKAKAALLADDTGNSANTCPAAEVNLLEQDKEQGSIIMLIATDIPLSARQLHRVSKRCAVSLGRTGSFLGNGSGDIAIAFSTGNRIPHYSDKNILEAKVFYDEGIDPVFEAAAEAVEESIVSSLYHAETVTGVRNTTIMGLRDYIKAEALK